MRRDLHSCGRGSCARWAAAALCVGRAGSCGLPDADPTRLGLDISGAAEEGLCLFQLGAYVVPASAAPPDVVELRNGTAPRASSAARKKSLAQAILDTGGALSLAAAAADLEAGAAVEVTPPPPPLFNATLWRRVASPGKNATAAEILFVSANKEGDTRALLSSLALDSTVVVAVLIAFTLLRRRFEIVYSGGILRPITIGSHSHHWGLFHWIPATLNVTIDELQEAKGLDAAMLIEFTHLAAKIVVTVGIPLFLVLCPAHWFFGGMAPSQVDALNRLSMANIAQGSWLYWLHALLTWFVVVTTEFWIDRAMEDFLTRRWCWLKTMPPPRSTTVLVENLPPAVCSDARLRAFFGRMFAPEQLEAVYVVRRTETLLELIKQRDAAALSLRQAQADCEEGEQHKVDNKRDRHWWGAHTRPQHFVFGQGLVDSVEYYSAELARLSAEVAQERRRVQEAATKEPPEPSLYATSAFVTFSSRRDAEIALRLQFKHDAEQFVMSAPPDPQDVRWGDLMEDPTREALRQRFGYLCAIGLFVGFVPITVAISSFTNLDVLRTRVPALDQLMRAMPALATTLRGVLASLALTLSLSFLPTLFVLIFDTFFILKADAWVQHRLQVWYFWFQVIFLLLVTAIGSSIVVAFERIVASPLEIFGLLADSLPSATHFYLNFMVLQWVAHVQEITRYTNLAKYLAMRTILGKQGAKEWSEPEDQDCSGFGGRAARWAMWLIIALVFCQLAPLISLFALVNAGLCRLVYGYLLAFSETRKPDLGGVFFVQQLEHLRKGLLIYLALMVGVLLRRGPGKGPMLVAVGACLYQVRVHLKFNVWFRWRTLPFEEIVSDEGCCRRAPGAGRGYVQPELLEAPPSSPEAAAGLGSRAASK